MVLSFLLLFLLFYLLLWFPTSSNFLFVYVWDANNVWLMTLSVDVLPLFSFRVLVKFFFGLVVVAGDKVDNHSLGC